MSNLIVCQGTANTLRQKKLLYYCLCVWSSEADIRPSLNVSIFKGDENMLPILLCSSFPEIFCALITKQDEKILEMKPLGP